MTSSEQRSLNWKLLLLLLIASGSLICIVVISQQLIVRHWAEERRPEVKLEIRIPEDGWMSSQGNVKVKNKTKYFRLHLAWSKKRTSESER